MSVINKIFDFGKFYNVTEIADDAVTIDIVSASKKYTMVDQKTGSLFTSGRLVIVDKNDTDKFITIAFENCVENGEINGFKRYTLTIRTASDGSTMMMGLANSDDGSNNITNVIAGNKEGIFPLPADSLCLVSVGSAEYQEMLGAFNNAVAEVAKKADQMAMRIYFSLKRTAQENIDTQNVFELNLQNQFDVFSADELAARVAFEAEQQQNFDNFVATQRQITAKIKDGDATKLEISGGSWLDGIIERDFVAVEVSPALSSTIFYELASSTGALVNNSVKFTAGNFPICRIETDATEITLVKNYGAAYLISGAGGGFSGVITSPVYNNDDNLTSFTDADGINWVLTYDADGDLLTISDGTDTTTISRDSAGNFLTTILT